MNRNDLKFFAAGGTMQTDKLTGSVTTVGGETIYSRSLSNATEDYITFETEPTPEVLAMVEKFRKLRCFERMTGGKHELVDMDL